MSEQNQNPPPFVTPPPLPVSDPLLIDTRGNVSAKVKAKIPEVVPLELGKRQVITGLIGALAGCVLGSLAGNYFPFYGGLSAIAHYGSPAKDVLVRGHMAIGGLLIGSIGVVMPRFFARAMLWFGLLLFFLIAALVVLTTIFNVSEAKKKTGEQVQFEQLNSTPSDYSNIKSRDPGLDNRRPNGRDRGRAGARFTHSNN